MARTTEVATGATAVTADRPPAHGEPEVVSARPAYGARVPSWVTGLRQEIARNRASLLSARGAPAEENRELHSRIKDQLDLAEHTLRFFVQRNWLARLTSAGAVYEEVLAIVQVTSEDLLLIENYTLVQARLPALRAGIKAYLGATDPRFDEYIQLIDRLARSSEDGKSKASDTEYASSSGTGNFAA